MLQDNKFHYRLGKFQTLPLDADAVGHNELSGIGVFEMELTCDRPLFDNATDKRAMYMYEVSRGLAELVISSTVPPHLWLFEVDQTFREPFDLPEILNFGVKP